MLKLFKTKNSVSISPSIVVFSVFFLIFLYFLFSIRIILTWLFLSFLIMVALNPFVYRLENKFRLPRVWAIIVTYILVMFILVSSFSLIIPPLVKQLYQLVRASNLPWLQNEIKNLSFTLSEVGTIVDKLGSSLNTIYSVITSTLNGVITVFTIMIMSVYLMVDRKRLYLRMAWFTKNKQHLEVAAMFIDSLEHQLGGWVRGQLILMFIIGIVTYFGLFLLSIPYSAPLALLAAFLEIMPNLGPTIAAVPSIVVAFVAGGPLMALVVFLFYVLVQQLENNLLVPKIMKDNVDVSPLTSILSILIGLKLAGVIGALLAIPVYIIIRTIYSTWFRELILS